VPQGKAASIATNVPTTPKDKKAQIEEILLDDDETTTITLSPRKPYTKGVLTVTAVSKDSAKQASSSSSSSAAHADVSSSTSNPKGEAQNASSSTTAISSASVEIAKSNRILQSSTSTAQGDSDQGSKQACDLKPDKNLAMHQYFHAALIHPSIGHTSCTNSAA
jgi:hypothetical protein